MKLYELECYPRNGATGYTITVHIWAYGIIQAKSLAWANGYGATRTWRYG